jgi:SAM-dependent methyltransferase
VSSKLEEGKFLAMTLKEMAGDFHAAQIARSPWHDFARQDAYGYIITDLHGDRQTFWRSGEATVATEFLPLFDEFSISRQTALEIGCGVGRLAFPTAQHFKQVIGVDISPEMIRQAEALAVQRKVTNVKFFTVSDFGLSGSGWPELDGQVDFIYSLLVFQHLEQFQDIEQYLRLVRSWLTTNGLAFLQFDTRPATALYYLRNRLPDRMLPVNLRRGIRRIRRNSKQLESSFRQFGLVVLRNLGKLTENHRYLLQIDSARPVKA